MAVIALCEKGQYGDEPHPLRVLLVDTATWGVTEVPGLLGAGLHSCVVLGNHVAVCSWPNNAAHVITAHDGAIAHSIPCDAYRLSTVMRLLVVENKGLCKI